MQIKLSSKNEHWLKKRAALNASTVTKTANYCLKVISERLPEIDAERTKEVFKEIDACEASQKAAKP